MVRNPMNSSEKVSNINKNTLYSGNRWLRPQRKTESKPLEMITYPKKRERAAWQYFKILECCNHFAKVREDDGSTAGKLQVCDIKPSILEKYFFGVRTEKLFARCLC